MKNILWIVADELRSDALGCYGNSQVITPRIDALAEQGVRFDQHFTVHTKCVPARAAMYTGRYVGLDGHRTLGIEVQKDERNIASVLKENGYTTSMFQRNHSIDKSWKNEVFDEHIQPSRETPKFNPVLEVSQAEKELFFEGPMADYISDDEFNTEHLLDWLEKRGSSDEKKPFFANINWIYPHVPYACPVEAYDQYKDVDIELYSGGDHQGKSKYFRVAEECYGGLDKLLDEELKKKIVKTYYAMITHIDGLLGRIEDTLKRTGQWGNTIVVFTADHGDFATQYNAVEKWDTCFEDALAKIPLIIAGGGLPKGKTVEAFTENVDLFASCCEWAGVDIPYGLSGHNLNELVRDSKKSFRDHVYCEGGHEEALLEIPIDPVAHCPQVPSYQNKAKIRNVCPDLMKRAKMIRTTDYKYIHRITGDHELYDLKADPDEMVNIANEPSAKAIQVDMQGRLLDHLISHETKLPMDPFPIC